MGKVFIKAKQQFFKPGESNMYFTKSVTYSKISFDLLIKHIAADSGMSEGACDSESIAQVTLRHIPDEHRGLTLAETKLRPDTGILVMLVERGGEKPFPAKADTVFEIGDKLTVFGDYHTICKTFHAREHFADD